VQFIKTICVIVVLGALAYGAYTTLTGKPKNDPPVETANWDSPPRIELPGGDSSPRTASAMPAGPAGGSAPRYDASTAGAARIAPGGPFTGAAAATSGTTGATGSPPSAYPQTKAVPGPFDGGGAVHLISKSTSPAPSTAATSGPALTSPAGGAWSGSNMPNAVQPTSGTITTGTAMPAASSSSASASAAPQVNLAEAIANGQSCLAKQDYLHALDEFSKCFDNPNLSPADASRVQDLLDQLAGTVIYSREHLVESAHTVAPGETLQAIADKHRVPAGLLAKINGVADPNFLQPGSQLKVVRGPFDGVFDKGRGKLTLFLDGMYAGSFPLTPGFDFPDGQYTVEKVSKNGIVNAATIAAAVHGIHLNGGLTICGTDESSMRTTGDARGGLRGLSLRDGDDVCDILSVGSRIVVQP
jgi:LysM repeat protein